MGAVDDDSRGLSEFELIELFTQRPPDPARIRIGPGDDAAVTGTVGRIVTAVDAAVEGVHFRLDWSSPEQAAVKAVGAAVSDIAAMGAGGAGIDLLVALGVPRDTGREALSGIARGVARAAAGCDAVLTGGDTVSSPVLFLAVTVIAHLREEDRVLPRSGAAAGDLVAVTGSLGAARAGLWLLENPGLPVSPELSSAVRRELVRRQLEPSPRLRAGTALARSGASAMIDLSDGLIADLGHLATASSTADSPVRIRVDADRVPAAPGAAAVAAAGGLDPLLPVLQGGEDYELAVTLPPGRADAARAGVEAAGSGLTVIGEVEPAGPDAAGTVSVCRDGRELAFTEPGFDHLA